MTKHNYNLLHLLWAILIATGLSLMLLWAGAAAQQASQNGLPVPADPPANAIKIPEPVALQIRTAEYHLSQEIGQLRQLQQQYNDEMKSLQALIAQEQVALKAQGDSLDDTTLSFVPQTPAKAQPSAPAPPSKTPR